MTPQTRKRPSSVRRSAQWGALLLVCGGLLAMFLVDWEPAPGEAETIEAVVERATPSLPSMALSQATPAATPEDIPIVSDPPDEVTSADALEWKYAALVARLRDLSDDELDDLFGDYRYRTMTSTPIGQEFRDLTKQYLDERTHRLIEGDGADMLDRESASRRRDGRSTQEYIVAEAQVLAAMAEQGNDLSRIECRTLDSEPRERIVHALLVLSYGYTQRHLDTYMNLLRRIVASRETRWLNKLTPTLVATAVRFEQDPYTIWHIAMDSDMERLIGDVLLYLHRFPVEDVEPLLLLGIRDPRDNVRFGAMESIRMYGTDGRLTDPQAMARELVTVALTYPGQIGACTLFLETVGAIGQADPVLLELITPSTDSSIRHAAATVFVSYVDESVALSWVETWLGDAALFETAVFALGLIPGEVADAFLLDLYDRSADPAQRIAVLQAMSGRGPQFVSTLAGASRSRDAATRRAGLSGLLAMVGTDDLDAAEDRLLTEALLSATAEDPDSDLRQRAAVGLALHGSNEAFDGLRDRFLMEADAETRGFAGGLLLLASGADTERREWVERRIGEESLFVRKELESLRDTLRDPVRRQGLLDNLDAESSAWLQVDDMNVGKGKASDPIGHIAGIHRALQAAVEAWASEDDDGQH